MIEGALRAATPGRDAPARSAAAGLADSSSFRCRTADPHLESEAVLRLWRDNLSVACPLEDKFSWTFDGGPLAPPKLFLLDRTSSAVAPTPEVVGGATIVPRRYLLDGHDLRAALLAELTIDRAFRSGFPGLKLIRSVDKAWRDEFHFALGLPTDRALKMFLRAGYCQLGGMPRYVRVLRTGPHLRRRLPLALASAGIGTAVDGAHRLWRSPQRLRALLRFGLEWGWPPASSVEALWQACADCYRVVGVRSPGFLDWRFRRHPETRFEWVSLVDRTTRALRAYAILSEHQGVASVSDFFGAPEDIGGLFELLPGLLAEAGAITLQVRFFGDPRVVRALTRVGFVARGTSRAMVLAAGELPDQASGPQAAALHRRHAWFFTNADHEWA